MSRSNNTELTNPATKFFEWDGANGGFRYYDKEKKERIKTVYPFRFIVLDILNNIKGFDDAAQSGFWSNEVRDLSKEHLIVRNKGGVVYRGLYDGLNVKGTKYCQSVYMAYTENGEMKIGNIQMTGACVSSFIEFKKKNKVYEIAISVAQHIEARKGNAIYQIPIFQAVPVSKESDETAKKLDQQLQEYLTKYLAVRRNEVIQQIADDSPRPLVEPDEFVGDDFPVLAPAGPVDDLPF